MRKAYAGPQDQLTRRWYDSPIDSIGGINGELRWATTRVVGCGQIPATQAAWPRFFAENVERVWLTYVVGPKAGRWKGAFGRS